jgi:hypothetical protein
MYHEVARVADYMYVLPFDSYRLGH